MNNTSRTQVLSIVGVAAIMLVIGMALGSVVFPMTKTTTQLSTVTLSDGTLVSVIYQTTTQTSTLTLVSSVSGQSSYPTITITWQVVEVVQVVPTCTTVSGKAMVVYYYGYFGNGGGESTTATYIYPNQYQYQLPPVFFVTVITNSTASQSNHTQAFTGSCG